MKQPPIVRAKCGTDAGWNAHNRGGELQCGPCKAAHTKYTREYRHRTGRSQSKLYTGTEIATIQAKAKAEALREAATESQWGAYGKTWLTARADIIEGDRA